MRKGYTHIAILIDRSGSMSTIKADVIGGFNQLIEDQKKVPGELTISLVQFDTGGHDTLNDFNHIDGVKLLTEANYQPRGGTPLNDSFARIINETGAKLAAMDESNRPDRVLVVSITDGEENSSHEYSTAKLKELIKHQEEKYDWNFMYIGANQDAFAEGGARGIGATMSYAADSKGTRKMSQVFSNTVSAYRGSLAKMDTFTLNNTLSDNDKAFDAEEKKKEEEAKKKIKKTIKENNTKK